MWKKMNKGLSLHFRCCLSWGFVSPPALVRLFFTRFPIRTLVWKKEKKIIPAGLLNILIKKTFTECVMPWGEKKIKKTRSTKWSGEKVGAHFTNKSLGHKFRRQIKLNLAKLCWVLTKCCPVSDQRAPIQSKLCQRSFKEAEQLQLLNFQGHNFEFCNAGGGGGGGVVSGGGGRISCGLNRNQPFDTMSLPLTDIIHWPPS